MPLRPSVWRAIPFFLPLAIFPLIVNAALQGGWWMLAPLLATLASNMDPLFGVEKRNIDPNNTRDRELIAYKLPLWLWAVLWPPTLVFALWQMLVAGDLGLGEGVLMAAVLVGAAQSVFIVGHELVHMRSAWERRVGEFLLSSASYPQYASEHVYVHHVLVGTPSDSGSAPKSLSFWRYFPKELRANLVGAWALERERLARRQQPSWHYRNPFWRYAVETGFWYVLVYWMAGAWAVPVYAVVCLGVVMSMKLTNYVQHYGLQRLRLANGRFERMQPHHSWHASFRLSNWLCFNMQRHADHHANPDRRYALLQYTGDDVAPQLPATYATMAALALVPRAWFRRMNPLVDQWRARFYPNTADWRVYESRAFAARPDAFEVIAEIMDAAPRLAERIDRSPQLLDCLGKAEFTDLELPDGFGPDAEFEMFARQGLARLYWTHELGVAEMLEQIAEIPVRNVEDTVEAVRYWMNGKAFQVGVHTMRGNLSPLEAGQSLANIAEASIVALLHAMEQESDVSQAQPSGMAAVVLGDLASGQVAPGLEIELILVHDDNNAEHCRSLSRRIDAALRDLSADNLLFAPFDPGDLLLAPFEPRQRERRVRALWDLCVHHGADGAVDEVLELTRARCVHSSGREEIADEFEEARRRILGSAEARELLIRAQREPRNTEVLPAPFTTDDMPGGLWELERAVRRLQVGHGVDNADLMALAAQSIVAAAGDRALIADDLASRLVEAANLWRSLRGILLLVMEEAGNVETAPAATKAVVARACGMADFDSLGTAVSEMASRTVADLEAAAGRSTMRR